MRRMLGTILLAAAAAMFTHPLRADDDAAKAQKLIDRAIQAMGGDKALEKTRNTVVEDEGTYYGMGDGLPYTGRYVFVYSNPSRFRMEIKGVFVSVADGDKAWISTMGETTDLEGEPLETAKRDTLVNYAMSLIPLQQPNKEFKLSLAEDETIEGEECQGIRVDHADMPTCTMHFSRKTGLLKKSRYKTKSPEMGFKEVTDETVFHKYKKFDGFLTAVKMTVFRDGKKFVESNIKDVSYPEKIDEQEFKKPE